MAGETLLQRVPGTSNVSLWPCIVGVVPASVVLVGVATNIFQVGAGTAGVADAREHH